MQIINSVGSICTRSRTNTLTADKINPTPIISWNCTRTISGRNNKFQPKYPPEATIKTIRKTRLTTRLIKPTNTEDIGNNSVLKAMFFTKPDEPETELVDDII